MVNDKVKQRSYQTLKKKLNYENTSTTHDPHGDSVHGASFSNLVSAGEAQSGMDDILIHASNLSRLMKEGIKIINDFNKTELNQLYLTNSFGTKHHSLAKSMLVASHEFVSSILEEDKISEFVKCDMCQTLADDCVQLCVKTGKALKVCEDLTHGINCVAQQSGSNNLKSAVCNEQKSRISSEDIASDVIAFIRRIIGCVVLILHICSYKSNLWQLLWLHKDVDLGICNLLYFVYINVERENKTKRCINENLDPKPSTPGLLKREKRPKRTLDAVNSGSPFPNMKQHDSDLTKTRRHTDQKAVGFELCQQSAAVQIFIRFVQYLQTIIVTRVNDDEGKTHSQTLTSLTSQTKVEAVQMICNIYNYFSDIIIHVTLMEINLVSYYITRHYKTKEQRDRDSFKHNCSDKGGHENSKQHKSNGDMSVVNNKEDSNQIENTYCSVCTWENFGTCWDMIVRCWFMFLPAVTNVNTRMIRNVHTKESKVRRLMFYPRPIANYEPAFDKVDNTFDIQIKEKRKVSDTEVPLEKFEKWKLKDTIYSMAQTQMNIIKKVSKDLDLNLDVFNLPLSFMAYIVWHLLDVYTGINVYSSGRDELETLRHDTYHCKKCKSKFSVFDDMKYVAARVLHCGVACLIDLTHIHSNWASLCLCKPPNGLSHKMNCYSWSHAESEAWTVSVEKHIICKTIELSIAESCIFILMKDDDSLWIKTVGLFINIAEKSLRHRQSLRKLQIKTSTKGYFPKTTISDDVGENMEEKSTMNLLIATAYSFRFLDGKFYAIEQKLMNQIHDIKENPSETVEQDLQHNDENSEEKIMKKLMNADEALNLHINLAYIACLLGALTIQSPKEFQVIVQQEYMGACAVDRLQDVLKHFILFQDRTGLLRFDALLSLHRIIKSIKELSTQAVPTADNTADSNNGAERKTDEIALEEEAPFELYELTRDKVTQTGRTPTKEISQSNEASTSRERLPTDTVKYKAPPTPSLLLKRRSRGCDNSPSK